MPTVGWYDQNYMYRIPVSIIDTVGASPADATFVVPSTLSLFWSTIQSSGLDMRMTAADGVTPLTYDQNGFVYATKTLTIELDNINTYSSVNSVICVWLYWGYAAATDGKTVFAPAAALSGVITPDKPPPNRVVNCGDEPPGATKPRNTITKPSTVTDFIYWDLTDVLIGRNSENEKSLGQEGVFVSQGIVYLAGVPQAAIGIPVGERYVEWNGRFYVKTKIAAGSSGVDYTASCFVATRVPGMSSTEGVRILEYRALLKVLDVSEV